MASLFKRQFDTGNVYKIYNTFPKLKEVISYDTPYSFFNRGPHNNCIDTLNAVFNELDFQNVYLQGILLKPNMIVSGKDSIDRASNQKVAEMTIKCLENTVPKEVPGIIFLSGGQEDAESLENLDSINKLAKENKMPWELSFSYGRGLQSSTLKKWEGKDTNLIEAQKEFISRCEQVSLAREGLA